MFVLFSCWLCFFVILIVVIILFFLIITHNFVITNVGKVPSGEHTQRSQSQPPHCNFLVASHLECATHQLNHKKNDG